MGLSRNPLICLLIDYYNYTFSVQKNEDGMKKQNNIFWIAFVNQLPVGYAKLTLNSKSEFIDSKDVSQPQKIYVLKDFLSMGIGLGLQDSLSKEAKSGSPPAKRKPVAMKFEQNCVFSPQIGLTT